MLKQVRLFCCLIIFLKIFTQPSFAQITISEVYPNPKSEELEWVELFNQSNQDINLENWQLWDQLSKPSLIHQFTTEKIMASSYLIIELKNVLNNSGDSVIIYNDQQQIQDSLTYDNSAKGLSWSKNFPNLEITMTEPSPNKPNLFPTPTLLPTNIPTPQPTLKAPVPTISIPTTSSSNLPPIKTHSYPSTLLQPTIDLPQQKFRALQTIFFEPPQLEQGAISVIIGGLLLLIPGFIYAKKQELF
ncbi:MAG: lamin tail domain-containing protein [Patescibacteria group bacterium]